MPIFSKTSHFYRVFVFVDTRKLLRHFCYKTSTQVSGVLNFFRVLFLNHNMNLHGFLNRDYAVLKMIYSYQPLFLLCCRRNTFYLPPFLEFGLVEEGIKISLETVDFSGNKEVVFVESDRG